MTSLLAALGDVERSSQHWAVFPQRVNTLSKPNSSRGMKNSSVHKTSASRKNRSIHAPFVKKNRSWNDSTYNCMNVYPHMESMGMSYCVDCSPEDENLMSGYEDEAIESDESRDGFDNDNSMLAWTSAELTCGDNDDYLRELGRKPQVFDDATTMTFYISPVAISQLAMSLWTRSRPACVIMNTRIPRGLRFDNMDWSEDSLRMLNTPNAGGSSLLSEVLSCEMLNRCLGATLAKTEMEIRYLFECQPITDYTISLPNLSPHMHVGVSVTRAFAFKASSRNVVDERFFKQILHVWVPNGKVARTVQATYKSLPVEVTRNTAVIISVVNAAWVFSNRR
ncbi:hypothetical protein BG011_006862 [Mortierella polycephala]|uniref:Uncharacterized protein n=1 Tax=Mortierella polycephala TaxID=41804 RepID=A0A9P6PV28_9FUNG|nr:hypothetical protein BG011_006862 [Mortierella polycephala]